MRYVQRQASWERNGDDLGSPWRPSHDYFEVVRKDKLVARFGSHCEHLEIKHLTTEHANCPRQSENVLPPRFEEHACCVPRGEETWCQSSRDRNRRQIAKVMRRTGSLLCRNPSGSCSPSCTGSNG